MRFLRIARGTIRFNVENKRDFGVHGKSQPSRAYRQNVNERRLKVYSNDECTLNPSLT